MKQKMVKRILAIAIGTLIAVSVTACSSSGNSTAAEDTDFQKEEINTTSSEASETAPDEVIEVTFAHIFEPGHTLYNMAESFAEKVEEQTNGHLKINLVPAGSLGGMDSNLEALDMGTIDICLAGESYTSTYYAPLAVSTAPYAFQSWEHFRNYLDSDFYKELKAGYTDVTGNYIIGTYTSGFRSITSNKEIRKPEDLAGVKIRVPDAPAFTAMPIACGASPTPMALSEVYLALQQGVVDAQENPLETSYNQAFYEVCDYVCLTEHMMEPSHIVVSGSFWDKLTDEEKEIVTMIAKSVAAEATDAAETSSKEYLSKFEEAGCTIVTDIDKAAFAELCLEFNTNPERDWTSEQWEALQNLQ